MADELPKTVQSILQETGLRPDLLELEVTENILLGRNLSEYHTGYRAWSRLALQTLPMDRCSDDFVFDNQVLVQAVHWGFRLGEIEVHLILRFVKSNNSCVSYQLPS